VGLPGEAGDAGTLIVRRAMSSSALQRTWYMELVLEQAFGVATRRLRVVGVSGRVVGGVDVDVDVDVARAC
jgi:hypothetical protein